MTRISTLVIAAAIVAASVSVASAQSFSAAWGTGNALDSHFQATGKLVQDVAPGLPPQDALSAYAAVPRAGQTIVAPAPGWATR